MDVSIYIKILIIEFIIIIIWFYLNLNIIDLFWDMLV